MHVVVEGQSCCRLNVVFVISHPCIHPYSYLYDCYNSAELINIFLLGSHASAPHTVLISAGSLSYTLHFFCADKIDFGMTASFGSSAFTVCITNG